MRVQRFAWIGALIVMSVLAGACGTRLDHAQVVAQSGASARGAVATAPGFNGEPGRTEGGSGAAAGAGSSDAPANTGTGGAASSRGTSAVGAGAGRGDVPGVVTPGAETAIRTVVVATVGNYSGVAGTVFGEVPAAIQAWAKDVNANGRLGSSRVSVVAADDGGDPSRNRALVQEMVEVRGAVAFIANFSPLTGYASTAYLEAHKVPVVGGLVSDRWLATSPMQFPVSATFENFHRIFVAGVAQALRPTGKKKVALWACIEADACRAAVPYWERYAPQFGLEVVYKANTSLAQPDYTAECLAARNAGAEVLMIGLDGNSIRRIAASCVRQGYHPLFGLPIQAVDTSMLKVAALDGVVVASTVYPWFLRGNRGAQDFGRIQDRYLPALHYAGVATEAWVSAKVFEHAVASGGGGVARITSASVLDGLWATNGYDVDGLAQPLRYAKGKANPQPACWYNLGVVKGRFVSSDNGRLNCVG